MFNIKEEYQKLSYELNIEKCTTTEIKVKTCSLNSWKISEENRKYVLDPLALDGYCFVNNTTLNNAFQNMEKQFILQIISDIDKPPQISVDFEKTCVTDSETCVNMTVVNSDIGIQEKSESFKFNAIYLDQFEDEGFIQILKNRLFPKDILNNPKSVYEFHAKNCFVDLLQNKKVQIEVFPKYELSGELSISYGRGYTTAKYKKKGRYRNKKIEVVDSLWKIDGKIDYLYGSTHLIFEAGISTGEDKDGNRTSHKVKRKKVKDLFKGLQKNVNKFHKFFEDANKSYQKDNSAFQTLKFEPGLTSFTFKVDSKLVEVNEQNNVGFESSIEIGISVFKGSQITLDIVQLLLSKGNNKISKIISKAREAAKKGYDGKYLKAKAELILELRIGGGIDGVMKWTRVATDNNFLATGSITGSVSLQLEGKIHAEGKVFFVKAAIGAFIKNASTKSENEPSKISASLVAKEGKDGDMEVGGKLDFNGLTIYYAAYAEIGIDSESSNSASHGGRGKSSVKREFKSEGNLPILEEWASNQESQKINKFVV